MPSLGETLNDPFAKGWRALREARGRNPLAFNLVASMAAVAAQLFRKKPDGS